MSTSGVEAALRLAEQLAEARAGALKELDEEERALLVRLDAVRAARVKLAGPSVQQQGLKAQGITQAIRDYVAAHPGCSGREMVERLGGVYTARQIMTNVAVMVHAKDLVAQGKKYQRRYCVPGAEGATSTDAPGEPGAPKPQTE